MNKHSITKENLLATLPMALRSDPAVVALTESLAAVLADRPKEIERLKIYPVIDTLEEPLLDILANDFKVDWWDPNYTLEEKRRTLKSSWLVHKTLGTKSAVEAALCAIFPGSEAKPWFEYGGKPYHYKLVVDISGTPATKEKQDRVVAMARFYKSLRDQLDGIDYKLEVDPAVVTIGGVMSAMVTLPVLEEVDMICLENETAVGGRHGANIYLPVNESQDVCFAESEIQLGGNSSTASLTIPVREERDGKVLKKTVSLGGGLGASVRAAVCVGERKEKEMGGQANRMKEKEDAT